MEFEEAGLPLPNLCRRMPCLRRVLVELRSCRLWQEHISVHSGCPGVGNGEFQPRRRRRHVILDHTPLTCQTDNIPSRSESWFWTHVYPARGKRADGFHCRLIVDLVRGHPPGGQPSTERDKINRDFHHYLGQRRSEEHTS